MPARLFAALLARRWALLGLFCAIGLPLLLFGGLADEVWEGGRLPFDVPILNWLHGLDTPFLDQVALTLSLIGGPLPMVAVAALLFLGFCLRRHYSSALLFLTIVFGSALLNVLGKLVFRRERPDLWISLAPEADYSFPSGHAMGSMALVAALIFLAWHTRWRWPILIVGTLFVAGVGFSRLYLGVHYPSDILAGWSASLAWAFGVQALWRADIRTRWQERAAARRRMRAVAPPH
jgi:membrane-associated phospholipid phosphatase